MSFIKEHSGLFISFVSVSVRGNIIFASYHTICLETFGTTVDLQCSAHNESLNFREYI